MIPVTCNLYIQHCIYENASIENKQQVVPNYIMLLLPVRTDQSPIEMDLATAILQHGTVCIDRSYCIYEYSNDSSLFTNFYYRYIISRIWAL